MTDIEAKLDSFLEAFTEHTRSDERQFGQLAKSITDGISGLREDLANLKDSIDTALSGDDEKAGIRERIRTLERTEQNRKWATGILFVAVVGIVLKEAVDWIHAH